MKRYILLAALLPFCAFAQLRPLSVGDTLPDVVLRGFLRDSTKQAQLSDYYRPHRLLLLDFSATWCVPCVAAWPKLDSLKTVFKGELEVLAVSQEKRAAVRAFFNRHPELGHLNFDFLSDAADKPGLLPQLFPLRLVPQAVWINAAGRVIAITSGDQVNAANIRKAITEQSLNLRVKKDVMNFDLASYELPVEQVIFQSAFTRYIPGIPGALRSIPAQSIDDVRVLKDLLFTQSDVALLYRRSAWPHESISASNHDRVLWEIPDSLRARYDFFDYYRKLHPEANAGDWFAKNGYCYEVKSAGLRPAGELYAKMIADLNSYFHLNGHFERRKMSCWILKTDDPGTIQSKGDVPAIKYKSGFPLTLTAQPMERVLYFLNRCITTASVVDETGIKGAVDLDLAGFNGTMTSGEVMNQVLSRSHLRLEKGEREVPVFVISL